MDCSCDFKNKYRLKTLRDGGAVLVELSMAIPFVLLIIFSSLWMTESLHANSSLTAAVGNSLRLGITRGDYEELGEDILEDVPNYIYGWGSFDRLETLLVTSDVASGSPVPPLEIYNEPELGVLSAFQFPDGQGYRLEDLPARYLYSLVYIKAAMKNSLGNNVRFPCDPNASDGAGCLLCVFRNPDFPQTQVPYIAEDREDFPRRIAIECSYRQRDTITSTLERLVAVVSGGNGAPLNVVFSAAKAGVY